MQQNQSKPSERSAVLAVLPPLSSTNARTSGFVKPALSRLLKIVVSIGANTATGVLTLLRAAAATGGSTQSVATAAYGGAGTVGNDKVFIFNAGPDDVTADRAFLGIDIGAAGTVVSAAVIEGHDPRFGPASGQNVADVSIVR